MVRTQGRSTGLSLLPLSCRRARPEPASQGSQWCRWEVGVWAEGGWWAWGTDGKCPPRGRQGRKGL